MTWQPGPPTSTPPSQENHERQYSHHLLEIGCGTDIGTTPWLSDANISQYSDADITLSDLKDPERMEKILEASREHLKDKFTGTMRYLEMNAARLKLPDNSMDEIFMANLLGYTTTQPIDQIIKECARVLRIDGELVIVETLTPNAVLINAIKHPLGKHIDAQEMPSLLEKFAKKFTPLGLEVKTIEVPYSMDTNYTGSEYTQKFAVDLRRSENTFVLVLRKKQVE